MLKREKQRVIRLLLVFSTLIICVGYAALTSNLYINGTTQVAKQAWNIYFENVVVTSGSVSTTSGNEAKVDSSNPRLITYSILLDKLGDYYEFTVDVVNDGSLDAMVDGVESRLDGTLLDTSTIPYLDYSVTYADGVPIESKHSLKAGASETYKVRIQFKTAQDLTKEELNSMPEGGLDGVFSFQVNYVQDDGSSVLRSRVYDKYSKKIVELSNINTEGVNISTNDHNNELRFIGSNPNNYVIFNNEASCDSNNENCSNVKWRIIGVFDGKLKLIRDSIGSYSWDTSGTDVNNGYGVNQWGPSTYTDTTQYDGADLMKLLNPGYESNQDLQCKTGVTNTDAKFHCGEDSASDFNEDVTVNNSLYWNGGSGLCYCNGSYQTKSCNFASNGLTDTTSRNMIDDVTWYLGSNSASINIWTNDNFNGQAVYTWERQNTNLGKQCSNTTYCSDAVNRTATWTGKVGLLYPSDYIYATSGGSTYDRDVCLAKSSGWTDGSWQNWTNTYTDCYSNDWLKPTSWSWSLSPRAYSGYSNYVSHVHSSGYVGSNYADDAGVVRPVVYIKSSVTISGGNGTQSSPYYLQ